MYLFVTIYNPVKPIAMSLRNDLSTMAIFMCSTCTFNIGQNYIPTYLNIKLVKIFFFYSRTLLFLFNCFFFCLKILFAINRILVERPTV